MKCTHTVWQMRTIRNGLHLENPARSVTLTTKPFSGFDLLHFYESVFPLIMESLSEAIKRKLSNRDYKMEKMRGHVGNLTCRHGCVVQMMFTSWIFSNM